MKFILDKIKSPIHFSDLSSYKKIFEGDEEKDFYNQFLSEQLILRDRLAIERTILANESTFLGYIRTSLTMIAGGVTLLHFTVSPLFNISGAVLIAGGLVMMVFGSNRYRYMKKTIRDIRENKKPL